MILKIIVALSLIAMFGFGAIFGLNYNKVTSESLEEKYKADFIAKFENAKKICKGTYLQDIELKDENERFVVEFLEVRDE